MIIPGFCHGKTLDGTKNSMIENTQLLSSPGIFNSDFSGYDSTQWSPL